MVTLKIDILVKPREKTDKVERIINDCAKLANIKIQLNRTSNFALYTQHAINPSMTPIIIINGSVEFAGSQLIPGAVKRRLKELALIA